MIELIMKYIAYGYITFGVCVVTFYLMCIVVYDIVCIIKDTKERKRK